MFVSFMTVGQLKTPSSIRLQNFVLRFSFLRLFLCPKMKVASFSSGRYVHTVLFGATSKNIQLYLPCYPLYLSFLMFRLEKL